MAGALYCTVDDLKDRMGELGVELRIDDLPPSDDQVGASIKRASRKIDMYASLRYGAGLANSAVITDMCADLAIAALCRRRGNPVPESVAEEEAFWLNELEQIRRGLVYLPDAAELRVNGPVLSKQRVVLRPYPAIVTERRDSTGIAEGYKQQRDPYEGINISPSDWVI